MGFIISFFRFSLIGLIGVSVWHLHAKEIHPMVEVSQKYLQTLRSIPYEYTDLNVQGRTVIRGIPKPQSGFNLSIETLTQSQISNLEFIHYTTPEAFDRIQVSKKLLSGKVAFVQSPFIFVDLTGVFLTLRGCSQERVGLDARMHSKQIQVKVAPGFPVLKIDPCIFLVPFPAPKPEWMGGGRPAFLPLF